MTLTPIPPTDTRSLFRPTSDGFVRLLRALPSDAWERTAVGTWQVRDVVAHMTDSAMRRVAFHQDGHTPPPPPFAIASDRDFVRFINQINADWVGAFRRLSTRQLADLYEKAAGELAAFFESMPMDAPGLFGVSWAGEMESAGWFDIGREYTEQWHHQAQVREAVQAPAMSEPAWLHATLLIVLRGLPHAYRGVEAEDGTAVTLQIDGDAGGTWTLERSAGAWRLMSGEPASPAARAVMTDDTAWRLLFNGLTAGAASAAIAVTGDRALTDPLLSARSIVI